MNTSQYVRLALSVVTALVVTSAVAEAVLEIRKRCKAKIVTELQ